MILRLPTDRPARCPAPPGPGPVVLFLPARDEEATVADVITSVPATVRGREVVTLVLDDGSRDATAAVAGRAGALVTAVQAEGGLGAAVRQGLDVALRLGAAAVAFLDADGEYDPRELPRLVAPILAGEADYVIGSRFAGRIEAMRRHRRLGNRILTRWVRWVVRQPVTDGQSGFRALSASAARAAEIAHDYNYAQVLTVDLLGKGYRYAEVPISYRRRAFGRSFVRLAPYLRAVVPAVHRRLRELHLSGRGEVRRGSAQLLGQGGLE